MSKVETLSDAKKKELHDMYNSVNIDISEYEEILYWEDYIFGRDSITKIFDTWDEANDFVQKYYDIELAELHKFGPVEDMFNNFEERKKRIWRVIKYKNPYIVKFYSVTVPSFRYFITVKQWKGRLYGNNELC